MIFFKFPIVRFRWLNHNLQVNHDIILSIIFIGTKEVKVQFTFIFTDLENYKITTQQS